MTEHWVQTMKTSIIKTIEKGEDVDLALLTYKTTSLNHRLPSPAELLKSRKYKTPFFYYQPVSYSLRTIQGGVYTQNRRFIKPDLTEAALPEPRPETEPRMTRPTRTIKKLDRLTESK